MLPVPDWSIAPAASAAPDDGCVMLNVRLRCVLLATVTSICMPLTGSVRVPLVGVGGNSSNAAALPLVE